MLAKHVNKKRDENVYTNIPPNDALDFHNIHNGVL